MIEVDIKDTPLDINVCLQKVASSSVGGTAVFIGTTRDDADSKRVLRLEFSAYHEMAVKEMTKIADSARQKWDITSLVIHHRSGVVKSGEIAVIIVASAKRRDAAFQACRYAIDTLKEAVPIWKKEVFEDGSAWVTPHP